MNLKTLAVAGATLVSLAVPAAAMAQPYGYYGGYGGWRDDDWRRHEWMEHRRWEERARWDGYYRPRCVIQDRGFYNDWGRWEHRPVRICYR